MQENNKPIRSLVRYKSEEILSDLQSLIRIPSVSVKKAELRQCANQVMSIMQRASIKSHLVFLDKYQESIPPIVYGEVISKSNPSAKTILFYNHYDVQPIEPIQRWQYHPFSGKVVGNKIYGRGSSDDKGELITRIKAVEYILRETGDVPCNMKFLVEGEEEIGSPHLLNYVNSLGNKLKCDGIIWEFGYVDTKNRPIINLGMKGMLYVELVGIGPSTDIHSSLAVLVSNPAWRMIKALNSLWDEETGLVTIKDWYNEVRKPSIEERFLMQQQPPFDELEFKRKYNMKNFVGRLSGSELRAALALRPTCNISGLSSGFTGKGAKTVLPAIAKATIDFRLVPDMNPKRQFERLKVHLLKRGLSDIFVKFVHGLGPSRTPFKHPFVRTVVSSAFAAYGQKPIINLSSAGSGPMSLLVQSTKAPCIAVGCSDIYSNIHSYNEFAKISLLNLGTQLIKEIIYRFAPYKQTSV